MSPSLPAGLRLYAIGDIHGRDDLIGRMHGLINRDLADEPVDDYRIVHLGDYVDRGPDSAKVVERLAALCRTNGRVICLKGNHDDGLLRFLQDPIESAPFFVHNGGLETAASYGAVPARAFLLDNDLTMLRDHLAVALPDHHRRFLAELPLTATFGDYLFVHAGVRPGVALDRQDPDDLIWIRHEFLDFDGSFGKVVVHGHTPMVEPDSLKNRIGIDTGAFATGRLTCVVLQDDRRRFLDTRPA